MGSPTRCPEGLHYSETEGICVWARDSGRSGCGIVPEEEKRKKKRRKESPSPTPNSLSDQKSVPKPLANGFTCPGQDMNEMSVHRPPNVQLKQIIESSSKEIR